MNPLLSISSLSVTYPGGVDAVRELSLDVAAGESVGVVGESGSGKSTALSAVLGLLGPEAVVSGSVRFDGAELLGAPPAALRAHRGRHLGLVFQGAGSALNPVLRVATQVGEAVRAHAPVARSVRAERVAALLADVGLDASAGRAFPHELSGGMRQRVQLALALASSPEVLLADEPTSGLDVIIQAGVLELLRSLQASRQMALVLVSHDVGVIASVAARVVVVYAGRIVEDGPTTLVLDRARHPYTAALLAAGRDRIGIPGEPPDPATVPTGCAFHPRCPLATGVCRSEQPELRPVGGVLVACHHAELAGD